jgi:indole-3-glycerol phosphate synthase
MSGFLERVVAERRADAAAARASNPDPLAGGDGPSVRSLPAVLAAARAAGRLAVIAEVKRVSPAQGVLRLEVDVVALARAYEAAGAAAISVLTEPRHWGGSLDDLRAVRDAVGIPVLCKDVVVDPYQLRAARAAGADAVLLIGEALDATALRAFLEGAAALGMAALAEAHEPDAFDRVVASGARIVGVNARDLRHPERLDPERIAAFAPRVPVGPFLVAESGIGSVADAARLPARVDAILVGTALMRAVDPAPLLSAFAAIRRSAVPA